MATRRDVEITKICHEFRELQAIVSFALQLETEPLLVDEPLLQL